MTNVSTVFHLSDRQDEGVAGSTARAAHVARVPARSVDRHVCGSRSGDQGGRDRDLQLLTARDRGAQRSPVDDHDGGRNKVTTVHNEWKALLHLGERIRAGSERRNDRGWPGAPANDIESAAPLEDEQG